MSNEKQKQKQDGRPASHPDVQSSSSFPLSSPSFWHEAAQIADGQPPSSPTPRPRAVKRARFDADAVADVATPSSSARGSDAAAHTTLAYLGASGDQAYLANAEYAPNKFGDLGDYMRKKAIKVQTQNRDIALRDAGDGMPPAPQIFAGLGVYINGNTRPPMEELRKLVLQRGGRVEPVLRSKGMVDYIVAPTLTQSKFREFARYKVVTEGWVVESAKAGRLLDWTRWKLQVEGGWEQRGRRGLEGFLKGTSKGQEAAGGRGGAGGSGPAAGASSKGEAEAPRDAVVQDSEDATVELDGFDVAAGIGSGADAARDADDEDRAAVAGGDSGLAARSGTGIANAPSPDAEPASSSAPDISPSPQAMPPVAGPLVTPRRTVPAIPISPGHSAQRTPPSIARPEGPREMHNDRRPNAEAARALRDTGWRAQHTAERGNEAGFIDGYYQNSRLHHLSTWKAELRTLVAAAQNQAEARALARPTATTLAPTSLGRAALPPALGQGPAPGARAASEVIMHVDFDAFFVSAALVSRPHLRGKAVVVCHSTKGAASSTSEIASASYEARAKGVKNGMGLGQAYKLVGPELQTVPYEFETYKTFSLAFYTILMGYADQLQAVSVDEALLEVTGAVAARAALPGGSGARDCAVELAEQIRADVRAETGCEVSIGISHNILLAKIATRRAKPAGVHHLLPDAVADALAGLDVQDLPSVGYSMREKIEDAFKTTVCGQLVGVSKEALRRALGPKNGQTIWGYLRGIDDHKIESDKARKSVSAEINYGIRFKTQEQAEVCLRDLAAEVAKRLAQLDVVCRQITLKLMTRHPDAPVEAPKFLGHGWCTTSNRSASFDPTDDATVLGTETVRLLRAMGPDPVEMRGIGIQATKLEPRGRQQAPGQAPLRFKAAPVAVAAEASVPVDRDVPTFDREATELPDEPVAEAADEHAAVPAGIDPDFLAALPPELAAEVLAQHGAAPPAARAGGGGESSRNPAAHITRQLRPKAKPRLPVAAVAAQPLYAAWARRGSAGAAAADGAGGVGGAGGDSADPALAELTELGLDPDVFRALPDDMQAEVLQAERQRRAALRRRPAKSAAATRSPSRAAGSVPPVARPSVARPARPALLGATAPEDIMAVVRAWVETRAGRAPARRDADKVGAYLARAVSGGGLGGVEAAVDVLRHLRAVLRETWPAGERAGGGELAGAPDGADGADGAGEAGARADAADAARQWWDTWRALVARVNAEAVAVLGAPVRV